MTPDEIKRLLKLCDEASPGEWRSGAIANVPHFKAFAGQWMVWHGMDTDGDGGTQLCGYEGPPMTEADCTFIAAARTALPAALAEIGRLREAWKVINEPDSHPETCGLRRSYMSGIGALTGDGPYIVESPCTCGKHAEVAEARKVLNGE